MTFTNCPEVSFDCGNEYYNIISELNKADKGENEDNNCCKKSSDPGVIMLTEFNENPTITDVVMIFFINFFSFFFLTLFDCIFRFN
jgi:hypothetical protein